MGFKLVGKFNKMLETFNIYETDHDITPTGEICTDVLAEYACLYTGQKEPSWKIYHPDYRFSQTIVMFSQNKASFKAILSSV